MANLERVGVTDDLIQTEKCTKGKYRGDDLCHG